MSGLETLGLVANIFQIISFGLDTVRLCKDIYEGHSSAAELDEKARSMIHISEELVKACAPPVQPHGESPDQFQAHAPHPREPCLRTQGGQRQRYDKMAELDVLARKCRTAARDLQEEVRFLVRHKAAGDLRQTLKDAAKATWRKKSIALSGKRLSDYQKTLETHLLAAVFTQTEAIALKQSQEFEELTIAQKHFVSRYAHGHTKLSDLVRQQCEVVNQHTTQEIAKLHKSVEAGLLQADARWKQTSESLAQITRDISNVQINHSMRQKFLQSLLFPAIHERENDIVEIHRATFHWILNDGRNNTKASFSDNAYYTPGEDLQKVPDDLATEDSSNSPGEDGLWDNFANWLKSDSTIYWISGKPGSGKSTLVKFIIGNPLTRQALELWNPNPVILSHFFWKPGSQAQSSIKGLFSNLLHQLLCKDEEAMSCLLMNNPSFVKKRSYADWSVKEVEHAFMTTFFALRSPVCIFMDGLDEFNDSEGFIRLKKVIRDIQKYSNIKICVSSRPEPQFQRRFESEPHLRLQDLTAGDLKRYATCKINEYLSFESKTMPECTKKGLIQELVRKSGGVFLWMRLAVNSVIRGLDNGDSKSDILHRLDELPNELVGLYQEMWKRLNTDTAAYRNDAARYFNIIVAYQHYNNPPSTSQRAQWFASNCFYIGQPSIFQMAAATQPLISRTLVDQHETIPELELKEICESTWKAIELRCAGLVEVKRSPNFRQPQSINPQWCATTRGPEHYETLLPFASAHVGFIHRTAYDFIKSEDGQALRANDNSTEEDIVLALFNGTLAVSRLFVFRQPWRPWDAFRNLLSVLSYTKPSLSTTALNRTFQKCVEWHELGYLDFSMDHRNLPVPHSLVIQAWAGFKDLALSSIEASLNPATLATETLRCLISLPVDSRVYRLFYCRLPEGQRHNFFPQSLSGCLEPLLSLGADPNVRGFCFDIGRQQSTSHQPAAIYCSAFERIIQESMWLPEQQVGLVRQHLPLLLSTGPDLNALLPICLTFWDPHLRFQPPEQAPISPGCTTLIVYVTVKKLVGLVGGSADHEDDFNPINEEETAIKERMVTRSGTIETDNTDTFDEYLSTYGACIALIGVDDYKSTRKKYRIIDPRLSHAIQKSAKYVTGWIDSARNQTDLSGSFLLARFRELRVRLSEEVLNIPEVFESWEKDVPSFLATKRVGYRFVDSEVSKDEVRFVNIDNS